VIDAPGDTRFLPVRLDLEASAWVSPPGSAFWAAEDIKLLDRLPAGQQRFWGVPFQFENLDADGRWLWVGPGAPTSNLSLSNERATYIVFAHFCLPSPRGADDTSENRVLAGQVIRPGEHLADYVLVYADGSEARIPVRRRFEVNDAYLDAAFPAFVARPHREPALLNWRGPHEDGWWGRNQTTIDGSMYGRYGEGEWILNYWLYALENPQPSRPIAELRFESHGDTWIGLGAITTFGGNADPLRHRSLETVRLQSADGNPSVDVDLGVIGRRRPAEPFEPAAWLASDMPGCGEQPANTARNDLLVDVAASEAAIFSIGGYEIPYQEILSAGRAEAAEGRIRIELLPAARNWVRVTIKDRTTGQPTPARIHVRAADGRYLPPYGHRHEVNDRWFEDYGADLLLGGTSYAYVNGKFDIELPTGESYVEVAKGFEYEPIRQLVNIAPGQRDLSLEIDRKVNWRRNGWVSADTHVHFLSPQTAVLEAQAEGLNLLNLLATQWGDLFTNVGDFTGAMSGGSDDETIVWVGTENRQHFLGHMSLLGLRGETVGRMCSAGPAESELGDPVDVTMADWSDQARKGGGIVVIPHFPSPYSEVVADVALGKVDGLEIRDFDPGTDSFVRSFATKEWYRLLNAGFRVAAVGGTDKMSAAMPVGGVRTYSRIDRGDFSFDAWAESVRKGRTFTTSGPLIDLHVEGREVGDEIRVPPTGGTVEVEATAICAWPLSRLELVQNGRVIEVATANADDPHTIVLKTSVHVEGTGWIAARCLGPSTFWHIRPVAAAAHTSPIYISGAQPQEARTDLAYLQTMVEGGLAWLDTLATRADTDTHVRLRRTFLDAMKVLATKSSEQPSAPPRS
jgi:hypothetical protein